MNATVIKDWKEIIFNPPSKADELAEAIEHFLAEPENQLQENRNNLNSRTKIFLESDIDFGYESVFDIIDFSTTHKDNVDVVIMNEALSFKPYNRGQKPEIIKIIDKRATVNFSYYGGLIGWEKVWFKNKALLSMEIALTNFRKTWYNNRAQAFYDLISQFRPNKDLAWEGKRSELDFERDIQTIDYACEEIIRTMSESGYNVNPQTRFVVVAPIALAERLEKATKRTLTEGDFMLSHNVQLVITSRLRNQALASPETSQYFVCLPGRKAKGAYRQELILNDLDFRECPEEAEAFGRYVGIVGDSNQFRRCATT